MNIVITGATKGIGRAIAQKFAEEGANIAVCARNEEDLKSMADEFKIGFPTINFIYKKTDVSIRTELTDFGEMVLEHFDQIDVLVNNAGVFMPGNIHDEPEGALEKQINTNVYSAYHLTRQLLPRFIKQKDGHIFNMCSVASIKAYPNGGSYSISKFALLGFSKALREEMKPHHVRVTSLLPGATLTASWEGVDLPEDRFMKSSDLGKMVYDVWQLSKNTVIEEIVMRPQLGDI